MKAGNKERKSSFVSTNVGDRESRYLTTHQHITGYTVSFTLYMIFTRWTADNLK